MARKYYYLISGLREYSIDADTKAGFDAVALRDEIAAGVLPADRKYLREFYTFYDVVNLISLWNGKTAFNPLGNLTRQELEEELGAPERLPRPIADVIRAYQDGGRKEEEQEDVMDAEGKSTVRQAVESGVPFERTVWICFYEICAASGNAFIRKWYAFDKQLRNVSAAFTARRLGRDIRSELVGEDEINDKLSRNSSADFGLRGEIDYLDSLIQILENKDMLEKERRLDLLRWKMADELTEYDYFTMSKVLAYCAKINIIDRWMTLDKQAGYEIFRRFIEELTGREIVSRAVDTVEGLDNRAKRIKR